MKVITTYNLEDCKIIDLPKIHDRRGNLSFFEYPEQLPFQIERVYWIYDVPSGEIRGGHAFKQQQEFIIALSGSFDILLNDGINTKQIHLNRSHYGLYIAPGIWRHIENFSTNSLALIVSNRHYEEKDYIRNFEEFKLMKSEI